MDREPQGSRTIVPAGPSLQGRNRAERPGQRVATPIARRARAFRLVASVAPGEGRLQPVASDDLVELRARGVAGVDDRLEVEAGLHGRRKPAASIARLSMILVGRHHVRLVRAILSASASTSADSRSAGTTRLTRPIRSARPRRCGRR